MQQLSVLVFSVVLGAAGLIYFVFLNFPFKVWGLFGYFHHIKMQMVSDFIFVLASPSQSTFQNIPMICWREKIIMMDPSFHQTTQSYQPGLLLIAILLNDSTDFSPQSLQGETKDSSQWHRMQFKLSCSPGCSSVGVNVWLSGDRRGRWVTM